MKTESGNDRLEPNRPPRWAEKLLQWYCAPHLLEEIQGDLLEVYKYQVSVNGRRKARWDYVQNVLEFVGPYTLRRKSSESPSLFNTGMLKNYFITALRNIMRHPTYSFINVTGLTLGLMSSMLIFQYVTFENGSDRFHKKADKIYRIAFKRVVNDSPRETASQIFIGAGDAFTQQIPEIERFTRIRADFFQEGPTISYIQKGERTGFKDIRSIIVDSTFLSVFSFPLAEGDRHTALRQPKAILLTQSTARKIFGDENAIGRTVEYGLTHGLHTFTVTGVLQDVPANSHIQFDVLIPMETFIEVAGMSAAELSDLAWEMREFTTYVEVRRGADIEKIQKMMTAITARNLNIDEIGDNTKLIAELQPLRKLYFDRKTDLGFTGFGSMQVCARTGNERMVYFFTVIAIITLAVSLMSYINLSTVRSLDRAKEVGIRKVVGAHKANLKLQFFLESTMINLAALILAVLFIFLLMPTVNPILRTNFTVTNWFSESFLLVFGSIFMLGVFLSGLYPAFVLSSFRPMAALKGKVNTLTERVNLRKALVILQYTPAIALLVCTIVVFSQLNFMRNMDVGLEMDKLVTVRTARFLPDGMRSRDGEAIMKKEVQKLASIEAVSFAGNQAGRGLNFSIPFSSDAGSEGLHFLLGTGIDHDFTRVYGLKLLGGEGFREDMESHYDEGEQEAVRVLINVTAMRLLGIKEIENAVGSVVISADNQRYYIQGVLDDFNWSSAHKATDPVMLWYRPANRFMTLKIASADLNSTLMEVKSIYNRLFPDDVFHYEMADDVFKYQYGDDEQFANLFGVFSGMAILIASLGLFGLSAFSADRRSKEVGIRKVLGATVNQLVHLLSREFLLLVLISFVIASPFAWLVMHNWLHTFAFRIELTALPFMAAGIGALVIALFAVSWKAISAAGRNPVNVLKAE